MDLLEYYKNQNREQRELLEQKDEIIKLLKREDYEVKQSIYEELIKIRNKGQSNDIYKNIKMLDMVEKLIYDLYEDIQEEVKEHKNELDVAKHTSSNIHLNI